MRSTKKAEVKRKRVSAEPAEFKFDYTKARPNRFADRESLKAVIVLLDPDVAKGFRARKP
jgi:hypothetical protein